MRCDRELFTANALSRHFTWSHNILFVEDLYNNKDCCSDISDAAALESFTAAESQRAYDDIKRDMNIISCSIPSKGSESKLLSKSVNSHYKQHTEIEHSVSASAWNMLHWVTNYATS